MLFCININSPQLYVGPATCRPPKTHPLKTTHHCL